jgi:hypothetical protein
MKCPKCNYTSFDYNQVCPKCGNDNAEEQTRLKFSKNKPNPPFFLGSLVGMADSEDLGIGSGNAGLGASVSGGAYEGMAGQDLLIALDDLDTDDARQDSPEPSIPSNDEIELETDDSGEDHMKPLESEEDEILFELEPASEEAVTERAEESEDDQIILDLEEIKEEEHAAFQGDRPQGSDEIELLLADEADDSKIPVTDAEDLEISVASEDADASELFLSLDDLPAESPKADPSTGVTDDDEIVFELEDVVERDEATVKEEIPREKGFWDSEEINKQMAAADLEAAEGKKADDSPRETAEEDDENKEVDLFSDLDIEPLDLELSLEDVEKNPD